MHHVFCGWRNGTWFRIPAVSYQWILSPGLGLDPLLDCSLLYVQIVCHHQLTCLRRSCVHWYSGTSINDGTGFPDVLLNYSWFRSHPQFSLVCKRMYEAGDKIICIFVAGIIHNN